MPKVTDLDQRSREAVLANIRQELFAPAMAIAGYGELLREEAAADGLEELLPDLDRILAGAANLSSLIDRLMDPELSRELFADMETDDAEKTLRHDLRTPINGIKGYAEMLLEDLPDLGGEHLRPDFEKLLNETNHVLDQIGKIVDFSRGDVGAVSVEADASAAALVGRSMTSALNACGGVRG